MLLEPIAIAENMHQRLFDYDYGGAKKNAKEGVEKFADDANGLPGGVHWLSGASQAVMKKFSKLSEHAGKTILTNKGIITMKTSGALPDGCKAWGINGGWWGLVGSPLERKNLDF